MNRNFHVKGTHYIYKTNIGNKNIKDVEIPSNIISHKNDTENKIHELEEVSIHEINSNIDNESFINNENNENNGNNGNNGNNENNGNNGNNENNGNTANDENNNSIREDTDEIPTYTIAKESMINDFKDKLDGINERETIYEYHVEKLNREYRILSGLNMVFAAIVTLFGSLALGNIYPTEVEWVVVIFGFVIVVNSGVMELLKYKDKVGFIGKYIDKLHELQDDIDTLIKRIGYTGISDQQYYKELDNISLVVTKTTSSIFNMSSKNYYKYYERLKGIKLQKWDILHQKELQKERKYNEFCQKKAELLKKKLTIRKILKEVDKEAKKSELGNLYENDVFTIDSISIVEE